MPNLTQILKNHQSDYAQIIPSSFLQKKPFVFDFTTGNKKLSTIDATNIKTFSAYIESCLKKANRKMGAGGYGENRVLYFSSLFAEAGEPRSIHLGVDLWMPEGTEVLAPLNGKVHSFQDNNNLLDYGPTIILEHVLDDTVFYSLYGHLSRSSLVGLQVGQNIIKGEKVANLGESTENGQWPPHLHFQIISDMLGKIGDFPGVAKPSEKNYYLGLCPNPNLILQIPNLL